MALGDIPQALFSEPRQGVPGARLAAGWGSACTPLPQGRWPEEPPNSPVPAGCSSQVPRDCGSLIPPLRMSAK